MNKKTNKISKKLLFSALAIPFLSTSALAYEHDYDYEEYEIITTHTEEEDNYYEITEVPVGAVRFAGGGSSIITSGLWNMWGEEAPELANSTEKLFWHQFGNNFQGMLRNATEINQTSYYRNFRLEALYSINSSAREQTFTRFDFDIETDELIETDEIDTLTDIRITTFFSIEDLSGQRDEEYFRIARILLRQEELNGWQNTPQFLFFNDQTGRAYFSVEHSFSTINEQINSVSINLHVERILSDQHNETQLANLNIASILASHNATFVQAEENEFGGWSTSEETYEILGADFDPQTVDRLLRGELNISLGNDIYLSNAALVNNLLHLQFNEPSFNRIRSINDWDILPNIWHSVVNTAIAEIDWDSLDTEGLETLEDWEAFWQQVPMRNINFLYSVDNSEFEEIELYFNGEYFTSWQEVGERRFTEQVFYLSDLSVLNDLDIEFSISYFRTHTPLNLGINPFNLNVNRIDNIEVAQNIKINIGGSNYELANFQINNLGVAFNIVDGGAKFNDFNRFNPHDDIEISFTLLDGSEFTHHIRGASWGASEWSENENGELVSSGDLQVTLEGSAIDIENLQSLNVNGVTIVVR
ncbi:MAG: hypothetical protein FWF50_03620 [Defluviitaleaceae bacterium]|nr:hypothetical protein [Defluviitaleaceae bacterium]